MICTTCKGKGYLSSSTLFTSESLTNDTEPCSACEGAGEIADVKEDTSGDYIGPDNKRFNRRGKL